MKMADVYHILGIGKADMMYTHQMLDTSLQHVPDLIDSER